MTMNLRPEIKIKPHSASFTNLQISESFQHFRSVSYFEAVTNASLSGSRKSFESHSCMEKPKVMRMPSNSTPCTPKKIEIEKYSTLPVTANGESSFAGKKTRSSSLSSFFRKFRPKFHRHSSDGKNPWIVIEFAPRDDPDASSNSDKSDHSIELAVKSKAQHFTSLKDLSDNPGNDICNCALSNSRRDSTPKCNLNSSKSSINFDNRNKYKSEGSIFFRLSPRRRLENLKHMLKNFSKRRKFRTSTSLHSLSSRSCAYKSESCLKTDYKIASGAFSSFSQVENGRASSPVFHFCKQAKAENAQSLRHSADIGYLLKLPNSRSSNASLSSVLEDSSAQKRVQPPNTLSLSSKAFHDQQMLKIYRKMASVESIGACSLDFEASATDNFNAKDLTASECTLHSNGVTTSVHENSRNGDAFHEDISSLEKRDIFDKPPLSNGCKSGDKQEYTVAEIKLPSYVSISCAINGYANYGRFCRSRDNSPARSSFRKSSLEPSMLADMNRKESYESHRYSRSQSDCNGTMQSVFTESKRVTVSKQIQIPLKSSIKYTTEVTLTNGHTERTLSSSSSVTKVVTNGHSNDSLVLAKEVGSDGTKSLVQQRIESLYGKSVGDEIKMNVKNSHKSKDIHVNGVENSITSSNPVPNGKNHAGSVSPPVFRHLNEDFRKQLQMNIPKKSDSEKPSSKPVKKLQNGSSKDFILKKDEVFSPIPNGVGHDECDRIKSMTPPPIKSKSSFDKDPPTTVNTSNGDEKEGYKFLNLIDVEKEKIQAQVKQLESELATNTSLPEEAAGKIRAACGKANLLITQKFEQFRGLCWKNIEENPSVPFYTTDSDLAGFWDLVLLQVDDITATFKEIEAMKQNGWKEVISEKPVIQPAKVRHSKVNAVSKSNPTTPKRSAKSSELMKAREEARKQLLAAKKKGRQQTSDENDIAIFTPATSS
ncbi:Disks large-associated protein 1 [Araneus ventricosus]|uniref:Disks large-associated protein 1 n=1 Tax=Araneus ventricosus TaxID=182803 RepID=A0A4Y2IB43_ARAVE|nr:Disks large-associated protein 1 [Araneus ventricosus]